MIYNQTLDLIHENWRHLFDTLDQPWLNPCSLSAFVDAVHEKRAALDCVWGFIGDTLKASYRPDQYQRAVYNRRKWHNGLNHQSVSAPTGIIVHLYGPTEGRRHDSVMMALSGLMDQLNQFSYN